MPLDAIIRAQLSWAKSCWPAHADRRAPSLDANLILPMPPEVRGQCEAGGGGELGTPRRPGKMSSLRSSSALAYNFFAPWIGHDLHPLAAALGHQRDDDTLQFERKFPHGLSTMPPNLDVTLDNQQPRPLAIEYLDDAIEFNAVSYQQAFARLLHAREPMPGYFDYLVSRYFGG